MLKRWEDIRLCVKRDKIWLDDHTAAIVFNVPKQTVLAPGTRSAALEVEAFA